MRKHGALLGLTIMTLSATAGLSALWNGIVLAAAKCITEPNLQSLQSGHWYYHTDPVSHRKCWYVGRPRVKVPQTAPADSVSSPKLNNDSRISQTMDAGRLKDNGASHQPGTSLNEAARDGLFQEFLRWQERQNQPDSSPDKADRDALFREFVLWQIQHMDAERAQ